MIISERKIVANEQGKFFSRYLNRCYFHEKSKDYNSRAESTTEKIVTNSSLDLEIVAVPGYWNVSVLFGFDWIKIL